MSKYLRLPAAARTLEPRPHTITTIALTAIVYVYTAIEVYMGVVV